MLLLDPDEPVRAFPTGLNFLHKANHLFPVPASLLYQIHKQYAECPAPRGLRRVGSLCQMTFKRS